MEAMIRVLHIIGSMDAGGAETMIMNIYRDIDRSKFQFDFLLSKAEVGFYDDEIKQWGGTIHRTLTKSKHPLTFSKDVYRLLRYQAYDVVHVHASNSMAALPMFIARLAGVPKRIMHSHNSFSEISKIIHTVLRIGLNVVATHKLSCSHEASEWMYGKRMNEAILIHNPIDCSKFRYNETLRGQMRVQLGLNTETTYVHVGRFSHQKNHHFLLEVFFEIYNKDHNSVLLLIGEGELLLEIKQKAAQLGIIHAVHFLGLRSDVSDVLQASDAYIFPSFFEGLPLALLEAQASGLICHITDTISTMIRITDLIHTYSLQDPPSVWAEDISKHSPSTYPRQDYAEIVEKLHDAKIISEQICSYYTT